MLTNRREYARNRGYWRRVSLFVIAGLGVTALIAGVSAGSAILGWLTLFMLSDLALWAFFTWHQPGVVVDEEKMTVDPSGATSRVPLSGIRSVEYSESNRVLTLDYLTGSSTQVVLPRLDPRELNRLLSDLRTRASAGNHEEGICPAGRNSDETGRR